MASNAVCMRVTRILYSVEANVGKDVDAIVYVLIHRAEAKL